MSWHYLKTGLRFVIEARIVKQLVNTTSDVSIRMPGSHITGRKRRDGVNVIQGRILANNPLHQPRQIIFEQNIQENGVVVMTENDLTAQSVIVNNRLISVLDPAGENIATQRVELVQRRGFGPFFLKNAF